MSDIAVSAPQSKPRPAGAEAGVVVRARINKKFTVEITATRLGIFCAWSPELPRKLSQTEFARYRIARDEAIAGLAKKCGFAIALIDA